MYRSSYGELSSFLIAWPHIRIIKEKIAGKVNEKNGWERVYLSSLTKDNGFIGAVSILKKKKIITELPNHSVGVLLV